MASIMEIQETTAAATMEEMAATMGEIHVATITEADIGIKAEVIIRIKYPGKFKIQMTALRTQQRLQTHVRPRLLRLTQITCHEQIKMGHDLVSFRIDLHFPAQHRALYVLPTAIHSMVVNLKPVFQQIRALHQLTGVTFDSHLQTNRHHPPEVVLHSSMPSQRTNTMHLCTASLCKQI